MLFKMERADAGLLETARYLIDMHFDYDATPDVVHRTFFGYTGTEAWSPGFLGLTWVEGAGALEQAVMDEFYVFMTMRVRVVDHVPATRSVAYVEKWSLPLAHRMVQVIETLPQPNGKTRLRYRVAYDVHRPFRPFVPVVEKAFRRWFHASFVGLNAYLLRHPEASEQAAS